MPTCSTAQPVADTTNHTLKLLGQGNTHDAYMTMSDGYRAKVDEETFSSRSKAMHLDTFKDSTWNSRNVNNNDGRVSGNIEASDGQVEASATLIYEKSAWKVTDITRKTSLTGP